MCESEVALKYIWTPSHVLDVTTRPHYLIYIAETPEHLLEIKIEFLSSILLLSFQSHCVTLKWRNIDNPSSFSFRIKRPCSHWNSWFYPLKFWRNLRISTGQSNLLRSRDFVFIFTLNHAYYRSHPISTPFSLSSYL